MELNTYSYLQQFYQDFGWFGILMGPFFCGFAAGWLYLYMRLRPGLAGIYLAGLAAYCCSISTFVNMFTQEATWFFAVVGILIGLLVRPHSADREPVAATS
jgi:oligosaccharide repeat unit polymerase